MVGGPLLRATNDHAGLNLQKRLYSNGGPKTEQIRHRAERQSTGGSDQSRTLAQWTPKKIAKHISFICMGVGSEPCWSRPLFIASSHHNFCNVLLTTRAHIGSKSHAILPCVWTYRPTVGLFNDVQRSVKLIPKFAATSFHLVSPRLQHI